MTMAIILAIATLVMISIEGLKLVMISIEALKRHGCRNGMHLVVHSVPTDRQVQASMQMVTLGARGEHSNAQIQPESCLDRLIV